MIVKKRQQIQYFKYFFVVTRAFYICNYIVNYIQLRFIKVRGKYFFFT